METDNPVILICNECNYPYVMPAVGCPNPACYPGRKAYVEAYAKWQDKREQHVHDYMRRLGVRYNPTTLREIYERDHPAPVSPR